MTPVDVANMIGNYGFPIVCCGAMFWYMIKKDAQHKEESENMRKAIENNTLVIQQLVDKFKKEG
jgi:preprotein translocase subunit YajC